MVVVLAHKFLEISTAGNALLMAAQVEGIIIIWLILMIILIALCLLAIGWWLGSSK
jgi:flagellar basal body-associated protein FliL